MSGRVRRPHGIELDDPRLVAFWARRMLCSLTTIRADGGPHVVPVGATLDVPGRLVRVITSGSSIKVAQIRRASSPGAPGAPIALCQFEGRYWCTIEARARVLTDADAVADAERRYAARYREPRPNPTRVVIAGAITKVLGNLPDVD
ncbi:PPOX class probable F420-dependent enzyme [Kineosphaera limosa]|nr:pyridoxamine 5'-phosphate oxidase family protein [Kineosphaera limosa]NYE01808.1 PPOX class probable F420-dependent enzyme [Kineosphaera limosa]